MNLNERLNIIWTIAFKDIADALKNKTTLSLILGAGLMMVSGLALPLLLGGRNIPTAVVLDPYDSPLVREMSSRSDFSLRLVSSQAELEAVVTSSLRPVLGIVIPPDFHQAGIAGGEIEMAGYYAYWVNSRRISGLITFFEAQLREASGQGVRIAVEGHTIYPQPKSGLLHSLLATNQTILLLLIGLSVVPHLMLEEKETHTLELLLISPARLGEVVVGKAIAGIFYCLCGALVIFLLNQRWIVHWEIAVAALLLGAVWAVGAGLLSGMVWENPSLLNLWTGLLLMVLVVPLLVSELASARLPAAVQAVLPWIPSVAMMELIGLSLVEAVPAVLWSNVGILLVESLCLYALVLWRVRRSDV